MSVPNFSTLADLEVAEKFGVEVPEIICVGTMSNLNEVAFELS